MTTSCSTPTASPRPAASELFGEDRLVEAVQHLRGSSAEGMAQGIAEAALGFGGKLRDDLQVVVARLG